MNTDEEAIRAWAFARSETLELLKCLDNEQLLFKPAGDKWQPFYYQFTCLGRTQMVYTRALKTGKMDFAYFADEDLPSKHQYQTQEELLKFLEKANRAWVKTLRVASEVMWPENGTISKSGHLYRLIAHERLHHGQLIGYFTLAGIDLPPSFKQNWAL